MRCHSNPTPSAAVRAALILMVAGLLAAADGAPAPMRNKSYLIPGAGQTGGTKIEVDTSFQVALRPTGPDRDWTTVRVGLLSFGPAYTLKAMNLGVGGGRQLESLGTSFASGFVAVVKTDTPIAAGTDEEPTLTWLGSWPAASDAQNRLLRIQIQLAGGAELGNWSGAGGGPKGLGLGWVQKGNERLASNLTAGFSTAGGVSFGMLPQLVVEFSGHPTPVLPLLCIGDSTLWGYGDGDQYNQPYGVAGRLAERWRAAGVQVAPVNFARVGHPTDLFPRRLEMILKQCDFGGCLIQFGSINNVVRKMPYKQMETDWIACETILKKKRMAIVPWLSPGMNNPEAGWWTAYTAEQDWMIKRDPNTVDGYRKRLTDLKTGFYLKGMAFPDGAHPSDAGFTAWEEDSHAAILAALTKQGLK